MKTSIDILKTWFQEGDKPTEQQFANLIDSFHHKDGGDLITSYTLAANGDLTLTFSDGQTVTAEKFVLPNTMPQSFIDGLVDALNSKVSTETGKGLSTNDFTTALKQKLEALTQYVHPNSHTISFIDGLQAALDDKVDKVAGKQLSDENFTDAEKQKLAGLQNYQHPATHSIAEVSGLQAELDQLEQDLTGKVDKVSGKDLSDENFSATEKQKLADLYQTDPDGKNYHITRLNATGDIAPTTAEVANQKDGDTADVLLSDGKLEKWAYDGSAWSKSMTIDGGKIQFADEKSIIRYKSDIDKRQGYFDETNMIYYPNVIRYNDGNTAYPAGDEGYWGSVKLIPLDGIYARSGKGSSSGFSESLTLVKFPSTFKQGQFKMRIRVAERYYATTESATYEVYGKLTQGAPYWEYATVITTSSRACKVIFGAKDNVPVIAIRDHNSPSQSEAFYHIDFFEYGGGNTLGGAITPPSNWLTGWGFQLYRKPFHSGLTETIIVEEDELLPLGKIEVKDHLNSVKFSGSEIGFGEYFDIDTVNKRIKLPVPMGVHELDNTYFGQNAFANAAGYDTLALGKSAGENSNSSDSVYVGYGAGRGNVGERAICIGVQAGENNTKDGVIIIGKYVSATKHNQIAIGGNSVVELLLAAKLAVDINAIHAAPDNTSLKVTTINGVKTITV